MSDYSNSPKKRPVTHVRRYLSPSYKKAKKVKSSWQRNLTLSEEEGVDE